ncbi:hypothetical protein EYF80_007409 [Liparis tanakae]|uniref:Uncharacterized protein n=1 Tax=Liparis tanakae TaxID=230148 RepID=A0A4Z2IXS5_9TELE|nr:hypothetical protein EYF80_007409 [Liparis tanakae]
MDDAGWAQRLQITTLRTTTRFKWGLRVQGRCVPSSTRQQLMLAGHSRLGTLGTLGTSGTSDSLQPHPNMCLRPLNKTVDIWRRVTYIPRSKKKQNRAEDSAGRELTAAGTTASAKHLSYMLSHREEAKYGVQRGSLLQPFEHSEHREHSNEKLSGAVICAN